MSLATYIRIIEIGVALNMKFYRMFCVEITRCFVAAEFSFSLKLLRADVKFLNLIAS